MAMDKASEARGATIKQNQGRTVVSVLKILMAGIVAAHAATVVNAAELSQDWRDRHALRAWRIERNPKSGWNETRAGQACGQGRWPTDHPRCGR